MSSDSLERSHRRFVRDRRLATGLLVGMVALWVISSLFHQAHAALRLLRAFSEAAMIGALADWFAVTALFRHPLGLPIPHTAIIPRNKARLAEAIGEFLDEILLDAGHLTEKIEQLDVTRMLLGGLADEDPRVSTALADLVDVLAARFRAAQEADPGKNIFESIDAPALAQEVLSHAVRRSYDQVIVDRLVVLAYELLDDNKDMIKKRVRGASADILPPSFDKRISKMVYKALRGFLDDLRDTRDHRLRRRFRDFLGRFGGEIRTQSGHRRELTILLQGAVRHSLQDPRVGSRTLESARAISRRLMDDDALVEALNGPLRRIVLHFLVENRGRLAREISRTVEGWSDDEIVWRLEAQAGSDLQFIRINGTLVGGAVGLAIHLVSRMLD